jgi:flagellar hook-basal body complex protein FliE
MSNSNPIDPGSPFQKSNARRPSIFVKDAEFSIPEIKIGDAADLEKTSHFKNVLAGYLEDVNHLQHEADAQVQRLAAGETENLHEVMLAMDEAQTSFDLMMQIRSQLMKSYEQLMRGN